VRGLGGEQALRVPVYIAEPFFQVDGRRAVQFAQDFVVRGLGQGDVEVDVGFDTGLQCPGSRGRSPLCEVFFEDCGVVCRSPFGGFFGDRGFQYFPHFVQIVQVGASEAPLHRFVRGREAFDKCSGTLPYLQEPHVGQDPDCFAHGRAANPENLHQLRFGRQFFAHLEFSGHELSLQPAGQLFG